MRPTPSRERAAALVIEAIDPRSPAARTAIGHYFAELALRFENGFDQTEQSAHDAELFSPPSGVFVVARDEGIPIACGAVRTIGVGTGEIKRMWVDPGWRGVGLGARMLGTLEDACRDLGHDVVRLDTNDALVEARAMYGRSGYRPIDRYNDNPYATAFFEKRLR